MRVKITEHNLVEQIRKRNEHAISFIIQQYGGLLVAIMKRHLNSDHHAHEECLDDVLIAIWHHVDDFDEKRNSFKQWIAAIARHRAIDYQRKMIKRQQRFVNLEMDTQHWTRHEPMDSSRDQVKDVLDHLTEVERTIFEKYYLEGSPSREIAEHLNVKESWIHNKLSRGRQKLKKILMLKQEV